MPGSSVCYRAPWLTVHRPVCPSTGGPRGATRPCPPSQGHQGPSCLLPPPPSSQKAFILYFYFFESEFGTIPKNGGLNPWSYLFWGTLGWDPAPSCPSPPLKPEAGSAGVPGLGRLVRTEAGCDIPGDTDTHNRTNPRVNNTTPSFYCGLPLPASSPSLPPPPNRPVPLPPGRISGKRGAW